jgi:hypothetical protein
MHFASRILIYFPHSKALMNKTVAQQLKSKVRRSHLQYKGQKRYKRLSYLEKENAGMESTPCDVTLR